MGQVNRVVIRDLKGMARSCISYTNKVSRSEGKQKDFVAATSQRLRQTLCSF